MRAVRRVSTAFAGGALTATINRAPGIAAAMLWLMVAAACRGESRAPRPAATSNAERVVVVVNSRSRTSDSLGRYYMTRRGIPASHLVRIDVPVKDDVGEIEFSAAIMKPVRAAIDSLPVRIDFIVLTAGVPLRIGGRRGYSVDAHLAGMRLTMPPMVGLDTEWLARYQNPYFDSHERFSSARFNMYLVTRLDCGKVLDCFALVDRCARAVGVRGPFFLDAAAPAIANPGYRFTNDQLYTAAARLRQMGADVELDTTAAFVAPRDSVMGYVSWGSNDVGFDSLAYHRVRFLPGALAETFVSTSARTFGTVTGGQSRIVDLVSQGVTGVKGYVSEPYSIALANPAILFDRYLQGFTLAESFYAASRMVLWKDVVVGDPLCAPYATLH